jgi:hypothetical protein
MGVSSSQSLIALALTVVIVFRFARRELRERTVGARTLWLRPAILLALAGYLISLSSQFDPLGDGEMFAVLAGGAGLGLLVGWGIVRNSRFAPAAVPHAVRVSGNRVTFGIWVAALAVRVLARYILPYGADPRAQLPLNSGTVMMTAVAFAVIALAFGREIRRYGSVPVATIGNPETMRPGTTTRQ